MKKTIFSLLLLRLHLLLLLLAPTTHALSLHMNMATPTPNPTPAPASLQSPSTASTATSTSTATSVITDRRAPTLRSIASSISSFSDNDNSNNNDGPGSQEQDQELDCPMTERTLAMEQRASEEAPLTKQELMEIRNSLENVLPKDSTIDLTALIELLTDVAHVSHKDWARTGRNSDQLAQVLQLEQLPDMPPSKKAKPEETSTAAVANNRAHMRQVLERILTEGNWDGAAHHAALERPLDQQPWAVLVTGVNGIRKTTSIYQPWFPQLLSEALVAPPDATESFPLHVLPVGGNSFFRQLDHMIATLCNEDFMMLYALTATKIKQYKAQHSEENDNDMDVPKSIVKHYSNLKAAIFTRYRTLSELLGAALLKQAQRLQSNCMMETSGRDIAMFHYIDHFFDKDTSGYHKLALHFTINDLTCAQQSVDDRMVREIQTGMTALNNQDVFDIIYANAGGPYGSEVLEGIQKASDDVWDNVVMKKQDDNDGDSNSNGVGKDWYKATIAIQAHPTKPWTARAVRPDGSLGTEFTFEPLNKKN